MGHPCHQHGSDCCEEVSRQTQVGLWPGLVIGVHISPIGYATLLSNMDQLQEGAVGVEDPGAEEAEDVGTHDVGQVGRKSQRWKT